MAKLSSCVENGDCAKSDSSGIFQARPRQIVLVDDDSDFAEELHEFLSFHGFLVHLHTSPLEAIRFMNVHEFDVLISDVEMPGMRGTQLAAWLNERRPDVKVILISGLNISLREFPQSWAFVQKPLDLSRLLQEIEIH